MNIIDKIESEQLKSGLPEFQVGDTVRVHTRVIEGEKERIQIYTGIVIGRRGTGVNASFSVRRVSYGEGVERVFPLHSPRIAKIEIERKGPVGIGQIKDRAVMDHARAVEQPVEVRQIMRKRADRLRIGHVELARRDARHAVQRGKQTSVHIGRDHPRTGGGTGPRACSTYPLTCGGDQYRLVAQDHSVPRLLPAPVRT